MDEKEQILLLIEKSISEENYFFQKLAAATKPYEWLELLNDRGYFDGSKNPQPVESKETPGQMQIPYWNVLGFLQNTATKNASIKNLEINSLLLTIVGNIAEYRQPNGERIDNYQTDEYLIRIISQLPVSTIPDNFYGLLDTFKNSRRFTSYLDHVVTNDLIPHLVAQKAKSHLLYVLNLIFPSTPDGGIFGSEGTMRDYYLNKISEGYHKGIYDVCGTDIIDFFLEIINKLTTRDKLEFSVYSIPSIEETDQLYDYPEYPVTIVRFLRRLFEYAPPAETRSIIENLLNREPSILLRFAIHTINFHFDSLADLFWKNGHRLFSQYETHSLRHEFFQLLKRHTSDFSDSQLDTIFKWIEEHRFWHSSIKIPESQSVVETAFSKAKWYTALKSNARAASRLEGLNKIHGLVIEHPDFDFYMSGMTGERSPISFEELSSKQIDELVEYLNKFEETADLSTKHGLSRILTDVITKYPERFIGEINNFLKVDPQYQYAVIEGFLQKDVKTVSVDWLRIFEFSNSIINSDGFWTQEHKEGWDFRDWILGDIASLVKRVAQDEEASKHSEYLERGEALLLQILPRLGQSKTSYEDTITSALNTTYGKIMTAIFALVCAHLHHQTEGERQWPRQLQNIINDFLSLNDNRPLEFSSVLGQYFRSLFFLDRPWATDNINYIFLQTAPKHWGAAFSSYLFYNNTVYTDIYRLLKQNRHYEMALDFQFSNRHDPHEKVIMDIAVAYFGDLEDLEGYDSLIMRIINNGSDLLLFVKNLSRLSWITEDPHLFTKTKLLWEKILLSLAANNFSNRDQILSELFSWIRIIPKVDSETFQFLLKSAPYLKANRAAYFVLKGMIDHVKASPEYVGRLFLTFLENNFYPFFPLYPEEDVLTFVELLIEYNQPGIAKQICEKYREHSIFFLRDTYEKHWG